jgi:type I restriction enzyme M protein
MQLSELETWLWDAACIIRGPVDAPKFKDYILPLIFLKRLSDVFEDELVELGTSAKYVDDDPRLVRFYLPPESRWANLISKTTDLGNLLTDAVRAASRANPRLQGVIDRRDFNETAAGHRILSDQALQQLIQVLNRHRLGLRDVDADVLGRAYEYLLRKFAEGQGQSAGEFYTPPEVATLMARILDPGPGESIYDPACGSGGLLVKCQQRFRELYGGRNVQPPRFFGQEINPDTFAMARMNAFIHDMEEAEIQPGDTMNRPAFLNADGSLRSFHKVTANPMWNQSFPVLLYENDPYGRFSYGHPPASSADWGWVQHMLASVGDRGKLAVVLDTGAVSRGSGNAGSNRERNIRKRFVEADLVEAVILLPENLFYNTPAPGIVLVANRAKAHPGEILLVNASQQFAKGRPKNFLASEHIDRVASAYRNWQQDQLSAAVTTAEAARNDYSLSPSRYVALNGGEEVIPLEEALFELAEAEEERQDTDAALKLALKSLGIETRW